MRDNVANKDDRNGDVWVFLTTDPGGASGNNDPCGSTKLVGVFGYYSLETQNFYWPKVYNYSKY